MRIYPAVHYTMGGLWVDYNLMSTIPGLFVLGEANFSDHGANRLGASALMQGLADGYFIIPYTIGDYLATGKFKPADDSHAAFKDGETIVIEPWRTGAFPIVKDLVVDRSALDRIIEAGGYISVRTGGVPDGNAIPSARPIADEAFVAAACIGCGACVAACKNASAMLFVSAKVSQLALLPQGHPERQERVLRMVAQMDAEGFGACSNTYACEAECPKEISVSHIARLNRELLRAKLL